jgi:REP element-mobilizing transposase RayT
MSTISNLPNRQSIRLSNYDYSQEGSYFITLVTQDRLHLFGKIEDGKMILNSLGKILEEEWKMTIQLRPNITLGEFIIMPDHMHMILTISSKMEKKEDREWIHSNPKSPSHTIGAIIRGFKGASTKKINLFLNSTGESQFAPTESQFAQTESQLSPTESQLSPTESQFAPTESQLSPTQSQFDQNPQFAPTNSAEFYKNKIFQRNYYEHIIRNQHDYNRIEQYIIDNPMNWKKKKLNLKIK